MSFSVVKMCFTKLYTAPNSINFILDKPTILSIDYIVITAGRYYLPSTLSPGKKFLFLRKKQEKNQWPLKRN